MTILATHKSGIEYLEHCALRASDERLVYVKKKGVATEQHFDIPNLNTAVILLGPGTSISQPAARLCAEGQILVAFVAGGGTPLYLASQSEYREPEYGRSWARMWEDEKSRLNTAMLFQQERIKNVQKGWEKIGRRTEMLDSGCNLYLQEIARAKSASDILLAEALYTKKLYALCAKSDFSRIQQGFDSVNQNLDMGNYLAYGLAACCLWTLGIPFNYPVVHGKTRRGALVFDLADTVKDAYILPLSFEMEGQAPNIVRAGFITHLQNNDALKGMFKLVLGCLQA